MDDALDTWKDFELIRKTPLNTTICNPSQRSPVHINPFIHLDPTQSLQTNPKTLPLVFCPKKHLKPRVSPNLQSTSSNTPPIPHHTSQPSNIPVAASRHDGSIATIEHQSRQLRSLSRLRQARVENTPFFSKISHLCPLSHNNNRYSRPLHTHPPVKVASASFWFEHLGKICLVWSVG